MRIAMRNKYTRIPLFILMGLVGVTVLGFILMTLWNALLPGLFHAPVITFWEALGLFLLSKLLFGGMHSGHRMGGMRHRQFGKRMEEKLAKMTPEEREKWKSEWHNSRCGHGHRFFDDKNESPDRE